MRFILGSLLLSAFFVDAPTTRQPVSTAEFRPFAETRIRLITSVNQDLARAGRPFAVLIQRSTQMRIVLVK
jgi:hypothetical protein